MLVKIEDAFVNPAAIAAVMPDNGTFFEGAQLTPPNPDRCVLITVGGKTIGCAGAAHHVAALLDGQKRAAD